MKKLLLSLCVLCAAIVVNAQTEVVFDFDNNATALFGVEGRSSGSNDSYVADGEFNEDVTATVDGVTVTVSASAEDATTRNRLWATKPVLRMYNGTLTVSAPGHKITAINFVSSAKKFDAGNTFSSGSYSAYVWTADSDVDNVVLTVVKNTQLNSMTVVLDGEGGVTPPVVEIAGTGEGTVESPYDVTRAVSLVDNGKNTSDKVYVKGTVVEVTENSAKYGNATYTITDGNAVMTVFRGYGLGGVKFTGDDGELQDGDVVVVYGALTAYNSVAQINTGSSIYSINGKTYEEPSTPEDPSTPSEPVVVPGGACLFVATVTVEGVETHYAMTSTDTGKSKMKSQPVTVKDGKVVLESADANLLWTLDVATGAIQAADGSYLAYNGSTNIILGENLYPWAYDSTNGLWTADSGKRTLLYGITQDVFGGYASSNVTAKDYVVPAMMGYVIDSLDCISGTEAAKGEKAIYTMSGVRVQKAVRGLYIVDGKKVVVK